jgi:hypothetical protein
MPVWVQELNSIPPAKPKNSSLVDPPGFPSSGRVCVLRDASTVRHLLISSQKGNSSKKEVSAPRKPPTTEETDTLKLKKAWELAIAPAKQLPMNAIGRPSSITHVHFHR